MLELQADPVAVAVLLMIRYKLDTELRLIVYAPVRNRGGAPVINRLQTVLPTCEAVELLLVRLEKAGLSRWLRYLAPCTQAPALQINQRQQSARKQSASTLCSDDAAAPLL